ncbi:MAG: helix-turn-helix transcriptional regulator [Gammaproteobacteria bacterium]|nr:helix-turn-helix transcriptional regulator [Gammaproteobacteria bacterium]
MLRRHYAKHGAAWCASRLPGREPQSVMSRAHTLRLRSPWRWTYDEDQIVRQHYPTGGTAACQSRLPRRSPKAIYLRASAIGLRRVRDRCVADPDALAALDGQPFSPRLLAPLRQAAGWTQTGLALRAGYSRNLVWAAEKRRRDMKVRTLLDILEALGFELILRRRT